MAQESTQPLVLRNPSKGTQIYKYDVETGKYKGQNINIAQIGTKISSGVDLQELSRMKKAYFFLKA